MKESEVGNTMKTTFGRWPYVFTIRILMKTLDTI